MGSSQSRVMIGVGVGLGVTALSSLSYLYYKYTTKEIIPTKWRKVGYLEELFFYPIKSCAGVKLDTALCENLGIREGDVRDRCLMLIDDTGKMVSARTYPKMFQIIPKIAGRSKLIITSPGMEDLEFDYSSIGEQANGNIQALIYGYHATVLDCGELYHEWFSKCITGKPTGLRLVYYPFPMPKRPVQAEFKNGVFSKNDTGTLQDVSSYMLINTTSVEDLNSRMPRKIPALQFRANFNVKTTGPAYDEDSWQWVRIGDEVIFRNVAPCYRCIMPNINAFSGDRDPEGEPLKTLKSYRIFQKAPSKAPVMGIQMGMRNSGSLKRGDGVYVEDTTK